MPEYALNAIYEVGNFIDTFALGHYARVLDATDRRTNQPVALKVMRAEHLDPESSPKWEAQAFVHEADLLLRLLEHPVPVKFYDCGYLSAEGEYPTDGELRSFGTNVVAFREGLFPAIAEGWRPYLALEYLPRSNNLFYLMQSNQQGQRRRLPTEEGIDLAKQFGELLQVAHAEGILYMDHKLEHVYWDGSRLRVIDWNSSKLTPRERQTQPFELGRQKDIHNLCVGILYSIFTGLSPQRGGLRPQPAGLKEVDARYANIDSLDFSSEPTLSPAIIELLNDGARQEIATAYEFIQRLEEAGKAFGWQYKRDTLNPTLRKARQHVREALSKLRMGEALIRESRESLLEAAILEDINEDLEEELRRLLKSVNDFLNSRPIP